MYDFFVKLLNMSFAASIIVLVIVVLRLLLKKAPKKIICILWALVALRLVLPFGIQSNLSVFNMMPSSVDDQGQIEYFQYNGKTEKPLVEFSYPALVNDNISPDSMTIGAHTSDLYLPPVISIWLAGVCVMFVYAIVSYLYLKKKTGASIQRHEGLKISDDISTPFILGVLNPVIYIPSGMDEKTLNHVIAHEEAHIKRKDHWWKPLGYFLLSVYWFNPIIWLAYVLLCRDIEMACDEKVVRELDNNDKVAYSQALLNCSFPRRRIAACPLAFGEVGVKKRVKSVLNYKKPTFWIIVAAVVACIVVGVCFLTNPKTADISFGNIRISWAKTLDFRPNDPVSRDLSTVQLEELKSRLATIKIGKEDSDFAGLTPFYSISAYSSQTGQFLLAGYNYDGKNNALMYKGKYYRINDADFAEYLSNICAGNDVTEAVMVGNTVKWFDCLHGDEMVWDGMQEINLDEFPIVTFRAYSERIEAVTDKEIVQLYTGMPIWSVYFCDLNGDGKPEICSSISLGSGMIDNRIIVADYANKAVYELSDRGHYDYILTCQNRQLLVEKRAYMQDEVLESGPLVLQSVIGTDGTVIPMLMIGHSNSDTDTSVVEQNYFSLPTDQYQDFETAIKSMDNNENTQVFDVYPVDNDIVLAGFTTGSDLSFATLTKSGNEEYKIRAYRELGRASLNSMTIIQEQNIDQSLTVALSNRLDLARVTAQYGGTILEKTVDCCPAMIVFEWKEILPKDATVTVRFYNADNKELERIEDSVDE